MSYDLVNQYVLDHLEAFKNCYQKGGRIYRFLSNRWRNNPLFLQRTLSYINKYKDRPVRRRPKKVSIIADTLRLKPATKRLPDANGKSKTTKVKQLSNNVVLSSGVLTSVRNGEQIIVKCIYDWICDDEKKIRQKTFSAAFNCAWCEMDFCHLNSLMLHLKCHHFRYNFNLSSQGDLPLIEMSANHSYDGSYCGFKYPGHNLKRDFKFTLDVPQRRMPTTQVIHFNVKRRNMKAQETPPNVTIPTNDDEEIDVDVCSGRLYYHTSTCLPIKPNEGDIDSEADMDPDWMRERTQLMIDEFTDVNEGEKELLKLWNLHIMSNYKHKSDSMVRQACFDFVEKEAPTIFDKKLTMNLTLHLVNLCDYGLIGSRDVLECVRKLRKHRPAVIHSPAKTAGKMKLERNEHCQHSPPAKRALLNSHCNQ